MENQFTEIDRCDDIFIHEDVVNEVKKHACRRDALRFGRDI